MSRRESITAWSLNIGIGACVLGGLALSRLHNYLLFHSLAELFAIVVAGNIFVLAWNSHRFLDNSSLLLLGIAYFFVGGLDLVHTLGYAGMGVFPGHGTNLPTQLWIAARYMESLSFAIVPFMMSRRIRAGWVFLAYGAVTALVLESIFHLHVFPDCFVESVGLTPFKKASEYIIASILIISIGLLFRKRSRFEPGVFRLLVVSIVLTVCSELAFTLYAHAYDWSNLIGHYLKIISFYLIYKALVETGLRRPYDLLFRGLKLSEQALQRSRENLEMRVIERTAELNEANERLRREIVEHQHVDERLRESEARLRKAQSVAHLGTWEWDILAGRLLWSEEVYRVFGIAPTAFEATYEGFLAMVYPDDREQVQSRVEEAVRGEREYDVDHRIIRPDGVVRHVHEQAEVARDDAGQAVAMVGIVVDITERREAEELARRHQEELAHVSRLRTMGEMASAIAHEVNQPLTAILSYTQGCVRMLKSQAHDPDDVFQAMQEVVLQARRAAEVIRHIREFSRKRTSRPSAMNINDVVQDTIRFLRAHTRAEGASIRLELDQGLPAVLGDTIEIEQVIINLVRNGIEAAEGIPDRSPRLTIKTSLFEPETVEVAVVDNGPGLPDGTAERVFDTFYSTKQEGMGIGLSLSRSIVEAHGGRLWATSNDGEGSTFRFTLPTYPSLSPC